MHGVQNPAVAHIANSSSHAAPGSTRMLSCGRRFMATSRMNLAPARSVVRNVCG
jgi:hypothetical protein